MFTNHVEYDEPDDGDKILGCTYLIFGILGAIMLIIMLCLVPGKVKYFKSAKRIMAEAVSFSLYDSVYYSGTYTFAFKDENDSTIYFSEVKDKYVYRIGKKYEFFYTNNEPPTIQTREPLIFPIVFLALMGGTFAGIGFIPFLYRARNRRQNRRYFSEFPPVKILGSHAEPVAAVITRIKKNDLPRSSMFYPKWKSYYTLECAMPDHSRTFESRPFWLDPEGVFCVGDEVTVVIDKSKPECYIVDVTGLFNHKAEGGDYGLSE
ncbi:MAG: hypothetical protein J5651_01030 [Salinivirgaceae bacterium]|nr:hypothetical protein [Salinivirgaceae bacterium]